MLLLFCIMTVARESSSCQLDNMRRWCAGLARSSPARTCAALAVFQLLAVWIALTTLRSLRGSSSSSSEPQRPKSGLSRIYDASKPLPPVQFDGDVLFFLRVHKTGSTTFETLMARLAQTNTGAALRTYRDCVRCLFDMRSKV